MDIAKIDVGNLPSDASQLRQIVLELVGAVDARDRKIRRIEHLLARLMRWRYGQKRERVDPNQLLLFVVQMVVKGQDIEAADEAAPVQADKPRRQGHGRRPLPENAERRQVVYDVAEKDRVCPDCRAQLKHIGEETAERLEHVPASWYVIEEITHKYACPNGCGVVTADKPLPPILKGLPGPGLLAQVAVSKYADHLPLYRQEEIFRRQGIELPRSTMCDWMAQGAELVYPLYELMKRLAMTSKAMQTDDTPVKVLDMELTRTRTGRIWTYVGDARHPYTVYDYTPSRAQEGPVSFMKDFSGYLQADAYKGYDVIYNDSTRDVTEVACWAHVRRKFFEAQTSDPMRSMVMLTYVRLLYDVERKARELKLDSAGRLALRQSMSVSVLKDIHTYLVREQTHVLPKSPEGMAIAYTLSNWEALVRYCEDGDLEIDNNGAERSLRGFAVGRRNWLFFGSDKGGRTAAVLSSLIATCKRLKVDCFAYMRDIFDRIGAHKGPLEELLPDKWQAARRPDSS